MLTHLYTTFDKSFYAGFALKVVDGAKLGDSICIQAFQQAGTDLGRHIVAVAPNITEPLRAAGLTVICIGSVWKSWELMKDAFLQTLKRSPHVPTTIKLLRLTESGAPGAAFLAAKKVGTHMTLDYAANTTLLCECTIRG